MTTVQKYLLIGGGVLVLAVGVYFAVKSLTNAGEDDKDKGDTDDNGSSDDNIDSVVGRKVKATSGLVNVRSEPKVDNGMTLLGTVIPYGDNIIAERGGTFGTVKSTTVGENNYTWYLVALDSTVDVEGGKKEGYVREDVVTIL